MAYFGTFGYELDITKLSEKELEAMKRQVIFMKEHLELIQKGEFYRLKSPFEHNSSAWMVVSEDKSEALFAYYRVLEPADGRFEAIRLAGLSEENAYQVTECGIFEKKEDENLHYGDELMNAGFSVSDFASGLPEVAREGQGDYFSRLFYLKKTEKGEAYAVGDCGK